MNRVLKWTFSGLLLAWLVLTFPFEVNASQKSAVMYFSDSPNFRVGDPVSFSLFLTTEKGEPLPGQAIDFFLDGQFIFSGQTDRLGGVRVVPDRSFEAGNYVIEAVYAGYQFGVDKNAVRRFDVSPIEIVVQTVPTIAGLELLFDGQPIKTGLDGIVRVPIVREGEYEVLLLPNAELLSSRNAVFSQWFPNGYDQDTRVFVPGETWMQVGFELIAPFNFDFTDPEGNVISPDRISAMTLRGSNGSVTEVASGTEVWLPVNRILARLSGLDSATVSHSIERIVVDGSVVVNQGQQRFIYSPGQAIKIELLMYNLVFYGEDVMLGTPIGTGLHLKGPDGETRYYAFDENREVFVKGLARGEYFAQVETKNGYGLSFPLVVTRSQEVRLPVISYFDMLAGLFFIGSLVIGLPLWGRRHIIWESMTTVDEEEDESWY